MNASCSLPGATAFTVTGTNGHLTAWDGVVTGNTPRPPTASHQPVQHHVKNCNISNFATGIYFNGSNNGSISSVNASTTQAYQAPAAMASSSHHSNYSILRQHQCNCHIRQSLRAFCQLHSTLQHRRITTTGTAIIFSPEFPTHPLQHHCFTANWAAALPCTSTATTSPSQHHRDRNRLIRLRHLPQHRHHRQLHQHHRVSHHGMPPAPFKLRQ